MAFQIEALESRRLLATLPAGFVDQVLVSGLTRPTALVPLPDGRFLVAEQSGKLRVIKNNQLLATPALTITTDSVSERGLLGVTIDPAFTSNGYIYIYWTVPTSPPTNAVSRYTMSGDRVVSGSGKRLLTLDPLHAGNHNAGALHFGLDKKLYVAVGDNAVPAYSQDLSNLHGKILRINPDGSIPSDNPFYTTLAGTRRAIWGYGLRNPFTFAVHPVTGRMHINDVGLAGFEEVNLGRQGANYGWPGSEGPVVQTGIETPVYAYAHQSPGQSIAGGAFYAPLTTQFPDSYANDYFFADYVGGWIKVLDSQTSTVNDFATGLDRPLDLDVLPDGSLIYLTYRGRVGRISYNPNLILRIDSQPDDVVASLGEQVRFTVEASAPGLIEYQWYRNGQPIPGATGASYIHTVTDQSDFATFFAQVRSSEQSLNTRTATLTVRLNNTAPRPTIQTPLIDTLFKAGETILFSGSAQDDQDGPLPASKLHWTIEYVTGAVIRPFVTFPGVSAGSFTIPTTTPYTQTDVRYRVTLSATDSHGATQTTFVDLFPQISTLELFTQGATAPISLDGSPLNTPAEVRSVEGLTRHLEAPVSIVSGDTTYVFDSWSDGGPRSRSFTVQPGTTRLTARYVPANSGSISGVLFNDNNANARFDSGDVRISRTVFLDLNRNARLDPGEPSQQSRSDGTFLFSQLPPGEYPVRRVFPTGYKPSTPLRDYVLISGQRIENADIGSVPAGTVVVPSDPSPAKGSISGQLFWDSNRNGRWDSGEVYQSGKTAYLDLNQNNKFDPDEPSRITDSVGRFVFTDLLPGTYHVTRAVPSGYTLTTSPRILVLAQGQIFSNVQIGTNTAT